MDLPIQVAYFILLIILALIPAAYLLHREKKLNEAQKKMELVHDDFTAKLVHELRAPLTVIRGATDMFLQDSTLVAKDQGKELLATMRHSSEDMLSMVNDLLDVYKIEAGRFQIIKTKGSLADVIHDRAVFFNQLAASKGITISVQIDDHNLPGNFDRERISQVFNNLLSNAIKFTKEGGRIIISARPINTNQDVSLRFTPPGQFVVNNLPAFLVGVSDTGEGIDPGKMSDLFSKYKQLHQIDGQKGSGLGLVIAKGIVESHGGQIFLESRPSEGTTVYFTLPLVS